MSRIIGSQPTDRIRVCEAIIHYLKSANYEDFKYTHPPLHFALCKFHYVEFCYYAAPMTIARKEVFANHRHYPDLIPSPDPRPISFSAAVAPSIWPPSREF